MKCLVLFGLTLGSLATWAADVTNHTTGEGDHTIVFTEELRFGGGDEDEHYFWNGMLPQPIVEANSSKDIFIADPKTNRVLQFDHQGQFKLLLAKEGGGPGEFTVLSWFQILDDDSAIGFQNQRAISRFSYFDPQGRFVEEKVHQDLKTIFAFVQYAGHGEMFYANYVSYDQETNKMVFKLGLFDQAYQLVRQLSESPWPTPNPSKFGDPNYWVGLIAEQMEGFVKRLDKYVAFLGDGNVMIVDADSYDMEIRSKDLQAVQFNIKNQYQKKAFSAEDKQAMIDWLSEIIFEQGGAQLQQLISTQTLEKAIEKADLPRNQRPALFPLVLNEDHFLVVSEIRLQEGTGTLDIFENSGRFIGKADLPTDGIVDLLGLRAVFRNDRVYTLRKNEADDYECVVYRYQLVKR